MIDAFSRFHACIQQIVHVPQDMTNSYPAYLLLALAIASLVGIRSGHAQERYIYWIGATDAKEKRGNTIFSFTLNGSVLDTLVQARVLNPNPFRPHFFYYVTVDTLRGHIYWTDSGGTAPDGSIYIGAIRRASLDGNSVEVFLGGIVCGVGAPSDIEIDTAGETLYWGVSSDCPFITLFRSDLRRPNSSFQIMRTSGDYSVSAIELDLHHQMIYWTNNDFFRKEPLGIYRARLSDTTTDEFLVQGSICDIALAPMLSKIYWTPCDSRLIRRANLDGSGAEDVFVSQAEIGKLAISHAERKIYWSETTAGKIRRANLDGNGVEDLLTGLVVPGSLDFGGAVSVAVAPPAGLPEGVGLRSVYPNPVRERATLTFTLAEAARVTLEIYDQLGRRVETLSSERYPPGTFRVQWKPGDQANGVYFCRLLVGNRSETIALVVRR